MRTVTLATVVGIGCLGFAATPARAQIPKGDLTITLELIAEGLTAPVTATHAGDGSGRLFIVDQIGLIRIVEKGVLRPEPFLDISDRLPAINPFFDERGLLGLAFHPDYARNGRFFVRYSAPRKGGPDEPCNDPDGFIVGCHTAVLAEYAVTDDPNIADPDSELILFTVDEPQFNHNAGHLAFGPEGVFDDDGSDSDSSDSTSDSSSGSDSDSDSDSDDDSERGRPRLLYFTLGDGGGANDSLDDRALPHGPIGNGQNIETVLGSVLRIDVDSPPQPPLPYAIPPDNPFVGRPGVDEIYAYGLRNPYRFSFDDGPGGDGRLFLGDVGQNLFEEINIIERGGNYGWVIREGFNCFDPFDPFTPPAVCDAVGPNGEPLLDPVAEYDHGDGIAVIGGFVYRGTRSTELFGKYIFGDFSQNFGPTGRLFWLDADGDLSQIFEFRIGDADLPLDLAVFGFGEDEDGEIYLLASENIGPGGTGGKVFLVVGEDLSDGDDDDDDDDDSDAFVRAWRLLDPSLARSVGGEK